MRSIKLKKMVLINKSWVRGKKLYIKQQLKQLLKYYSNMKQLVKHCTKNEASH